MNSLEPMNSLEQDYLQLIESARVSPQTRKVLLDRLHPDDLNYQPKAMELAHLSTLRQVMGRIIPQQAPEIDLAGRLDAQLAEAKGDGWRYASLPSDAEACRAGLSLLDEFASRLGALSFDRLTPEAQDGLLDAIALGRVVSPKLDLKRWFEDLRASATQIYVAHPQTLASMDYSGIADDPDGFVQIGINQREAWEPKTQ